jgi:outer membrane receptor for ferrienterochelin and colicins
LRESFFGAHETELDYSKRKAILSNRSMNRRKTSFRVSALVPPARRRTSLRRAISFLMLFLALGAPAADVRSSSKSIDLTELPLEALMEIEIPKVYGASKFEQAVTEAPSSVTVVTADEIKKYSYRTLADVLQSAQGFYGSYDRNYAFLGTRGMNLGDFNSRILVLVDGHRINNNLTDGAAIGTDFILDVDLIDRVEIIRGPGSVLYGNNAFFGVVNVITRKGKQVNGAEASGEYASYDTYKGRFTYGNVFTNGVELLLSGTLYDSAGQDQLYYREFDTPSQNNGHADDLDRDSFGSFFGSLGYQDLTLQGAYINRDKKNPTAQYFTTFNDDRLRTTDDRSYANLKYAHSFPDVVDVAAQLYYDRCDYSIDYPITPTVYHEDQIGEWWGTELQLSKRLWQRHTITLGAEYRDDFRQDLRGTDQSTGDNYVDIHRSRENYGFYGGGDFTVLTNLHFNGGVRFDHYSGFDPSVNPRLALIYNPIETATLKAIYGTAFRAPNFQELALAPPGELQPEEITSYELVYEQQIGRNLRSSLAGFYNQMDDLIVFENGMYTNFNVDAKGLELALEGFWTNGFRGRASYSFQQTDNRSGGQDLSDSPEHLVKINVTVPLYKEKLFAGVEFLYTSSRATVYTTTTGETLPGSDAAGYGIVNVTLFSQNIIKNLEFSAGIYNLLDKQYGDPASHFHQQHTIQQDGRTFRVKLTYRF